MGAPTTHPHTLLFLPSLPSYLSSSSFSSPPLPEPNAQIVADEQGIEDIASAMQAFLEDAEFMAAACSALWTLSAVDEIVDRIVDLNCITIVCMALAQHVKVGRGEKDKILVFQSPLLTFHPPPPPP